MRAQPSDGAVPARRPPSPRRANRRDERMTLRGAPYMIGVDIGGTFTDCVVMDAQGHIVTGKSPTTPDDRSRGFFNSIEQAADVLETDPRPLLENCSRLVH